MSSPRREGGPGFLWLVGQQRQPSQDPPERSTLRAPWRDQPCLVWVVWPLRPIPMGV